MVVPASFANAGEMFPPYVTTQYWDNLTTTASLFQISQPSIVSDIAANTLVLGKTQGGEWDLPFARGLAALGRVTYTGSQYIDATWPHRSLPEWARLDAGLRYVFDKIGPTGKPVALRSCSATRERSVWP